MIKWIKRKLGITNLEETIKKLQRELVTVNAEYQYMLSYTDRLTKRKWKRMTTNPKSPFFIYDKVNG